MCINGEWHFGALPPPVCATRGCPINATDAQTLRGELQVEKGGAVKVLTCHPGHVISGTNSQVRDLSACIQDVRRAENIEGIQYKVSEP